MKYLGMNVIKKLKGLYNEKYKTLMIEIKTDTISGKNIHVNELKDLLLIKCPYGLCFPIFPYILFFYVISQVFIKHSRKALIYIYINNMYSIYFRKHEFLLD